jgi:hypothetical protein
MRKDGRLCVSIDNDVEEVFMRTKGLAKNSTYVNSILRQHFAAQGLLPETPADEVNNNSIPA